MNRLLTILFCLTTLTSFAQPSGKYIYSFLQLSPSARISGLGEYMVSVLDDDASTISQNPALVNPLMDKVSTLNFQILPGDIQNGQLGYVFDKQKINTSFFAHINYINYGEFLLTDEYFQTLGDFSASEFAVTVGASRMVFDRLRAGASIRYIGSHMESYKSSGLALDLGLFYEIPEKLFSAGFVIKNAGLQLTTYRDESKEDLPLDVRFGISKKLEHLPFRLTITAHNLNRWNLIYDDPNKEEDSFIFIGDQSNQKSDISIFTDNFFRHLVFGGEFLLGKADQVRIRFAYNHLRRKELGLPSYFSLAGFSGGFGIHLRKFSFDYAFSSYHIGNGVHHFGISANLSRVFKKSIT